MRDYRPLAKLLQNGVEISYTLNYARSKSIHLFPVQIYGLLRGTLLPKALWRACPVLLAVTQLQNSRNDPTVVWIFEGSISTRASYCVGASGYPSFRTNECVLKLAKLYNDNFYDSDNSYRLANTLRQSTDGVMSSHLNDEGEMVSIHADSCTGNVGIRCYKRDSTSDAWSLYRDYPLGPSQRLRAKATISTTTATRITAFAWTAPVVHCTATLATSSTISGARRVQARAATGLDLPAPPRLLPACEHFGPWLPVFTSSV